MKPSREPAALNRSSPTSGECERQSKSKPISLSEARKIFAAIAPDVKTCEAHARKSLERTRYWNWFRMGIAAAQKGRITKNDVRWVNGSPWLKAHNAALTDSAAKTKGTK